MAKNKLKKQTPDLGRSLIRNRFSSRRNAGSDSFIRDQWTSEPSRSEALKSVTEESSIASFINETKLAGARFDAEREGSFAIVSKVNRLSVLTPGEEQEVRLRNECLKKLLSVPRRPQWDRNITPEQQNSNENLAFLSWRRRMAELEDKTGLIMTPFERNLEIWRQLWRVAEKSDLLLQIVDCRNPLLFMCSDLEEYAREIDPRKKCITVMNKSDLLSEKQRAAWVQYFKEKGIDYVFYSALSALKSAEEDAAEPKCKEGSSADESIEVYSASKLLDLINKEVSELDIRDRKAVVGFVGYPNVGKSSTINSLVGKKRQSVSSTPGKTKHFQTIHLSNSLIICDCPGLVFPSLATTKAELVCNGVLPIDQMRDYISPLALIIQRVPMGALESIYNIKLPIQEDVPIDEDLLEVTSRNFLRAYALSRGFTKSTQGNPDESRSARYILKDYVNAKITWCQPPPGCNEIEFNKDCYLGLTDGNLSSAQNPKDAKKMQKGSPQNDSLNGSLPDQKIENGAVNVRAYIIPNSMDRKSSIPFEEAKKMHKNTRRRQPKQRMAWTQDLL